MTQVTQDIEVARAVYKKLFPSSPFFDTWIPESHFVKAEFDESGNLSITRRDEETYGIAFGANPLIPQDWMSCSVESVGAAAIPESFEIKDEWDCYWAPTLLGAAKPSRKYSDEEITDFLTEHAPSSSVFPGNEEILHWIEISRKDVLVGVAAICRWQSGKLVLSSVATHADFRGQGIGKQVMAAALTAAHELGAENLCLGVMHSNESGHRLYLSTGFKLMHNFTYCERR